MTILTNFKSSWSNAPTYINSGFMLIFKVLGKNCHLFLKSVCYIMLRLVVRNYQNIRHAAQQCATNRITPTVCLSGQNILFRSFLNAALRLPTRRWISSQNSSESKQDDFNDESNYIRMVNQTLEELQDYFDEILETNSTFQDPDSTLGVCLYNMRTLFPIKFICFLL